MLLKRPATIHLQEGVFVPEGNQLKDVDHKWLGLCAANKSYYDGQLLHVLGAQRNGCGGANVHVIECAYRFFAVQTKTYDLGVRPLGLKGITTFGGKYLWGKRSDAVHRYAGMWEFAPGGCVEPTGNLSAMLAAELKEETGLELAAPPIQIAMLFDDVVLTWELVYKIKTTTDQVQPNNEYQELQWYECGQEPENRSPIAEKMLELV